MSEQKPRNTNGCLLGQKHILYYKTIPNSGDFEIGCTQCSTYFGVRKWEQLRVEDKKMIIEIVGNS
jgi:hypothetical protein